MTQQITEILERIAKGAVRKEAAGGCGPTELVHEAYMRLVGNENLAWESRTHFFAACSVVIRRILNFVFLAD